MHVAGITLALIATAPLSAQQSKLAPREVDKQIFDVLKEVHNRGADLYNAGQIADCYRLFQGSLQTAKAALAHRPAEQKFIADEMARIEKIVNIADRAFALHESIEELRKRLRIAPKEPGPELLAIPPREYRVEKKVEAKKAVPPKNGVMGVVIWNGRPLAGADIMFVSRGALDIQIAEAVTDTEGRYILDKVRPGTYTVILSQSISSKKSPLPDRYATATTSPLIVDVKSGGDRLDLLLR